MPLLHGRVRRRCLSARPPPPSEGGAFSRGVWLEPRWLLAFSTLIPPPFSVISQKVEMIPIKFTNGLLKGRAACDGESVPGGR